MIQLLWEKSSRSVVSPGQIQYTFVTPNINYEPNEFFQTSLQMLREFPRELVQLENAASFFDFSYKIVLRKSTNLFMFPEFLFSGAPEKVIDFFNGYTSEFNRDIVRVFLIDKAIKNHKHVAAFLRQLPFSYFIFIGDPGEVNAADYDHDKSFSDGNELIELIQKDLPAINQVLEKANGKNVNDFNFDINPKANEINPYYPMMYTKSNYFIINQILANFWLERPAEPTKEQIGAYTQRRLELQLDQINVLDGLHQVIKVKKPVTPIEPYYPSMIIAAPFHFPRYGKLLKAKFKSKLEKMLFRASQAEQELDYRFTMDGDIGEFLGQERAAQVLTMVTQRLLSLDYLAYLHAQFSYSPVFRLPIMGKSLNMDLSHFQQSFQNKRSAIEKIGSIGKLMREKMVADEFAKMLTTRNGQLVFISDLPMEWLTLNDYPICLTHDVCRVPEFNFSSLINNFMHNQRFEFRIKPDILKRTLIIHCASDDEEDMHEIFKLYDGLKPTMGFQSVICKSIADIDEAVKKHKPDLLIFDCHGDADPNNLSSYLVIDDKNDILLTGDDIIKHSISAPLVFISACRTMPNYGYVKFLSDAFFQAGAFAVTATFLPIKMNDAASLIIRLLSGLREQEKSVIFSNWLAFVSHTLRSTLIYETIRKERIRNNLPDVPNQDIADFLLEIMVFEAREKVFENVKEYLRKMNPDINTDFNHLEHEWLSYTNLGRADLVYFEGWVNKHQTENIGMTM